MRDGVESDDDCFTGNEGDESDTTSSDDDTDSGDSPDEVCN